MMEVLLGRWQFGVTTTYHFLFVPLTLGLSILLAIMETMYVRTGDEKYKRMTQFWGKLFLINFAMGVATGIVQEFQFGMNWSEYSRFMGDIFGAPLALEALTAFFLESTFLGLWIFGWDKLSKGMHALCIWIVALSSNLSAFWILVANSFMQHPVGYAIEGGRAVMQDVMTLITNPYVFKQFPHVFLAGITTAGVFVAAVSAYQYLRQRDMDVFRPSMKIGLAAMLGGVLLVMGAGHVQTQYMMKAQPMKLAAAEALWESADPAPFALAAVVDSQGQRNSLEIKVPALLTILAYDGLKGEVKGIKNLQQEYQQKYGPGNYIPDVASVFWNFRIMVMSGGWMLALAALGAFLYYRGGLENNRLVLKGLLWTLPMPYLANSSGWFVTEAGRQPWMVFGLQKVQGAQSPNLTTPELAVTLAGFTLLYAGLALAAVYLAKKTIVAGADAAAPVEKGAETWN